MRRVGAEGELELQPDGVVVVFFGNMFALVVIVLQSDLGKLGWMPG